MDEVPIALLSPFTSFSFFSFKHSFKVTSSDTKTGTGKLGIEIHPTSTFFLLFRAIWSRYLYHHVTSTCMGPSRGKWYLAVRNNKEQEFLGKTCYTYNFSFFQMLKSVWCEYKWPKINNYTTLMIYLYIIYTNYRQGVGPPINSYKYWLLQDINKFSHGSSYLWQSMINVWYRICIYHMKLHIPSSTGSKVIGTDTPISYRANITSVHAV